MIGLPSAAWTRLYAGVGLTTLATLLLELALTRVFSVVLFYHFGFMAISLALFGLGVGAVFSYYLAGRYSSAPPWSRLGWMSVLNVIVTAAALLVILHQQVTITVSLRNASKLAVIYFVSSVPFFFAGAVVSVAISTGMERVHRVYFIDLLGAGAACLLLVPLLNWGGGPNAVLAAAALFGVAGAVWFRAGGRGRAALASLGLSFAMATLLVTNTRAKWIDVRFAKGLSLGGEMFSQWNSFSRVAVSRFTPVSEPAIIIDGDAATEIPSYAPEELSAQGRAELLRAGPGLVYQIRPGSKTLIIGPGGGFDVARALAGGSSSITGVEINPIIVNRIMKDRFAAHSRNLYLRPEVQIHVEDGRSFVRRSRQSYQVIQMTLVDTWASTAAGAFALSENSLYTTDAFVDYLRHLTDDGLLSITRWEFEPPRESLRVVALAIEALGRLGALEPWRHVIIGRDKPTDAAGYGALDTVLVKRTPFRAEEASLARQAMAAAGMAAVYLPDEQIPNAFTALLRAKDPGRFAREYQYDITAVSDNRPFFFYTVRARDLWRFLAGRSEDVKINMGVMVLFALLATSLLATSIILLLPPLLLGTRVPREPGAFLHLGYFFAIGAGFIMVEVALIQQFVLFLGNPTYSLTVVVFSLLVATGAGSYWSRRLVGPDDRRLAAVLAAVAMVTGLLSLLAPLLLRAAVGLPIAARCALTVALLTPVGFVMGMPFPCGLKRLEQTYPSAIRWAWALNSASSVLGSVAAVFLAIHLGLAQTLLLSGVAYLLAFAVVRLTANPAAIALGRA